MWAYGNLKKDNMKYLVVFNSYGEDFSKNDDGIDESVYSGLIDATSKEEAIAKFWDRCEVDPEYDYGINVYEVSKNWFGKTDANDVPMPKYTLKAGK